MVKEVNSGNLDFIIHAGDMAYDMPDEQGMKGDAFMEMIEPYAASVPYMVCPGNHEEGYNFTHYINRFHMPGDESGSGTNLYSSFNVGNVHFVSISTELYFYNDYYTADHIGQQYNWLKNDLIKANTHRADHPWIIVFGHRPMYCSLDTNDGQDICTLDTTNIRDGVSFTGGKRQYGLEALLQEMGVDFFLSGHMHSYERLWPTYRQQLLSHSYENPGAPIHIIAGTAGGPEDLDNFDDILYPWSAFRSDSYGYGKIFVHNDTHIHYQQILDSDGSILDEMWLVNNHSQHPQLINL